MRELYAGIDIHKDQYVGCIMDTTGKVVREHTFQPTPEGAQSFLCGMPLKAIAIESCAMWRYAYVLFRELGYTPKLSSAKKTHDIACRKKTDKVDAKILADLLRTGYLPEVYIPSDEMLAMRDLCRGKANLTRMRVEVQLKIKSRLLTLGVAYPPKLWNKKNLALLLEWNDPLLNNMLKIRECIVLEEKEMESRVEDKARSHRLANLLKTIPGVGYFGALMIISEIADINRFKTPKELVMYAGLCPGIYQTGKTEFNVKNNAVNKWLKWILTECSGRASTLPENKFQLHYAQMKLRKNAKVARRSTARKMLTIVWHMLKNEQPFHASK
jgi:transposase